MYQAFSPHNTALLFPFYRKENSDSEKFSNLPKIIQLIGGENVCLMLKARHVLPMAVEEILMKPVYLVTEGSTGPSSWEQTGLQTAQEGWAPALAGEIVFDMTMKVVQHHLRFPGRDTVTFSTSLLKMAF